LISAYGRTGVIIHGGKSPPRTALDFTINNYPAVGGRASEVDFARAPNKAEGISLKREDCFGPAALFARAAANVAFMRLSLLASFSPALEIREVSCHEGRLFSILMRSLTWNITNGVGLE
jgi:hypothetical protein